MSAKPSFLAELQRRNVHRAAVFYAGAAWLIIQIATQVFPFYDLPAWTVRAVIAAVAIGFPFAMLFSWFYEWTTQGIKRESEIDHSESITRETGKKLDKAIIAVLGLAVIVLLLNQFVLHRFMPGPAASSAAADDKSIAVLPFENRSSDKENAYFANGIQDEILTRLAKIGALKVISRTSTQHYASSPDNLPVIAKRLGVGSILEGSVQKVGDQVRISVQLIEASTDTHLWAETYDRKLTDIFGVESEVAKSIAEALQAKLSGGEQRELAIKPTNSVEAYDAYLHGLAAEVRGGFDDETAARFFAQAAQLDPRFAQAWARLARVDARLVFAQEDTSQTRREASKQALDTAIALQPDSTDTLLAQAYYRYWMQRDYPDAKLLFEALRPRLPSSSDVPLALSLIERRQGFWDQSLAYSDQAIALDPLNPVLLSVRAVTYASTRRYAEAIKTWDRLLEIKPGDPDTIASQVLVYLAQGQMDQARKLLARLPSDQENINVASAAFNQSLFERDYPMALELLKPWLAKPEWAAGAFGAGTHAALGFVQRLAGDVVAAKAMNLQARRELEALRENEPDNARNAEQLESVYAELGEKALALKEGERAVALLPASRDALEGPAIEENLAAVEAQVGETSRAIGRLRHLLNIGYSNSFGGPITVALLKLDPVWDPLRGDPRFQKLIADSGQP